MTADQVSIIAICSVAIANASIACLCWHLSYKGWDFTPLDVWAFLLLGNSLCFIRGIYKHRKR